MASAWKNSNYDEEYTGCPIANAATNATTLKKCKTACDKNNECVVAQFSENKKCILQKLDATTNCYTNDDGNGSKFYFRFNTPRTTRKDIKHLLTQVDREQLLNSGVTTDQLAYLDDNGNESGSYDNEDQSPYSLYQAVVEDQQPVNNVLRYSSRTSFNEVSPDPKYDVATYEDISTLPNPWTVEAPALGCGFLPTNGGEWGGSYARGTEEGGAGGNFFYPSSLPEIIGPSNPN